MKPIPETTDLELAQLIQDQLTQLKQVETNVTLLRQELIRRQTRVPEEKPEEGTIESEK